jgi:hypothetical protein
VPTKFEKAINFVKSSARFALKGFPVVSEEQQRDRFVICLECPFFDDMKPADPICDHCGCYLNFKTLWATEKCPINKW